MLRSVGKFIAMLLFLTFAAAFTSPKPHFVTGRLSSAQILMSNPLGEVAEGEDASPEPIESTTANDMNVARNYGRAGEIREVNWTDPAMVANTNPFQMSIWAYFLFGYPLVLLADDFFHFVPDSVKDSPIGFMF